MFGNSVNLVLNGPATDFTPDTTPPYLVSYALDCNRANNTGELRLSFSESVNASTFDLTKLVFQDAALQTFKVRLATTGVDQIGGNHSTVISTTSSTEIFVWIMVTDMNKMKATGLIALSSATTYLTIDSNLVKDMSGNPLVPILDGNGRLVTTHISDQFRPILQSFDINMNTGGIIMTFDEPINRSTIKVSSFTIQNAYSQTISFTLIGTAGI